MKSRNVVPFRRKRQGRTSRVGHRKSPGSRRVGFHASDLFLVAGMLALVLGMGWKIIVSPWPVTTTLRHIAAAPNCAAARAVGLAPALRGQPGYYARHDADGDGRACEPYVRRLR